MENNHNYYYCFNSMQVVGTLDLNNKKNFWNIFEINYRSL